MKGNAEKKRLGQSYRPSMKQADNDSETPIVDNSREAFMERQKCRASLKYLYKTVLAPNVVDKRTGKTYAEMWSKIHDLMTDFLVFDELPKLIEERKTAGLSEEFIDPSGLSKYLPPKGRDGVYRERWLYWRTLDSEPEIQDGPEGPISLMFEEAFWQGCIIRIAGDGLTKCELVSRGHLKSQLTTQAFMLWKIIRDPSERHMCRSNTSSNATGMIGDVKGHFENNPKFRKLYGNLGPPARRQDAVWKEDMIQVLIPRNERRGRDATLSAHGIESEVVGMHVDDIHLDDVVGETNVGTPEQIQKVCTKVENLEGIRDPGTPLNDIGTRWERDDAHGRYINPDSTAYYDASFMVATLLDADEEEHWPLTVTPLGYGKPIWPEKWTRSEILKKRRLWTEDRRWFGQMFNQFHGTTAIIFKKPWLRYYENAGHAGRTPEEVAKKEKLNITIGIDSASGKEKQGEGRVDHTAIVVLGQSVKDRRVFYLLDGLKEKLPAEQIASAIVSIVTYWRGVANAYGGNLRVAIEDTPYINFLPLAVSNEVRKLGSKHYFELERISHENKSKPERIKTLTMPYANHCVYWPETIVRQPIQSHEEPYDFVQKLMDEMLNYTPQATRDDALDGHVYAYLLAEPPDYAQEPSEARDMYERGYDSRAREQEENENRGGNSHLAGYEKRGSWKPNL